MYSQVRRFATYHSKIAVVGAGCGGISFTSKAIRFSKGAI